MTPLSQIISRQHASNCRSLDKRAPAPIEPLPSLIIAIAPLPSRCNHTSFLVCVPVDAQHFYPESVRRVGNLSVELERRSDMAAWLLFLLLFPSFAAVLSLLSML